MTSSGNSSSKPTVVCAAHIEGMTVTDPSLLSCERLDEVRVQHALIGCLRELGDHVRGETILRYQQGFTFEEMSDPLNEIAGTLQALVIRALALLRTCIQARKGGRL